MLIGHQARGQDAGTVAKVPGRAGPSSAELDVGRTGPGHFSRASCSLRAPAARRRNGRAVSRQVACGAKIREQVKRTRPERHYAGPVACNRSALYSIRTWGEAGGVNADKVDTRTPSDDSAWPLRLRGQSNCPGCIGRSGLPGTSHTGVERLDLQYPIRRRWVWLPRDVRRSR